MMLGRLLVFLALLSATGCNTMPGPSPEPERAPAALPVDDLRALATEIEGAVAAGNRETSIADREGLIINTSEMIQAIRTRATRISILNQFLDTGHAWERLDGLIWVIRSPEYKNSGTRQDRDRNALVVVSENRDRWTLYQDLVKVNSLPRGSLATVRRIFAEVRMNLLTSGQKYETEPDVVRVKD